MPILQDCTGCALYATVRGAGAPRHSTVQNIPLPYIPVHVEGEEPAEVSLHDDVVVQQDHARERREHPREVEASVVEEGQVLGVVELHQIAGISLLLLKRTQIQYSKVDTVQ